MVVAGVPNRERYSEGSELAEASGLDPREVRRRGGFSTLAVLRAERRGMLEQVLGSAGTGKAPFHRRRRGHLYEHILSSDANGKRRSMIETLPYTLNIGER